MATAVDVNKFTSADAKGIIDQWLSSIGLAGLGSWAWNRYKETGSIDLVKLEMEGRPEYKQRFAGRLQLRDRGVDMTEAEQLQWESTAAALFHAAGVPSTFYDKPSDYQKLIGSGVSTSELADRINNAFVHVTQAPPEVRKTMGDYFGVRGDAAIAAFILDPEKAQPAIMQDVAAVESGGWLARQGFHVGLGLARHIASLSGNNSQQIQSGAAQLGKVGDLFDARFGEQAPSVETGIEATFGQVGAAQQELEHAAQSRQGGSSSFETSNKGVIGLREDSGA